MLRVSLATACLWLKEETVLKVDAGTTHFTMPSVSAMGKLAWKSALVATGLACVAVVVSSALPTLALRIWQVHDLESGGDLNKQTTIKERRVCST
jgi:hypothetical protein